MDKKGRTMQEVPRMGEEQKTVEQEIADFKRLFDRSSVRPIERARRRRAEELDGYWKPSTDQGKDPNELEAEKRPGDA